MTRAKEPLVPVEHLRPALDQGTWTAGEISPRPPAARAGGRGSAKTPEPTPPPTGIVTDAQNPSRSPCAPCPRCPKTPLTACHRATHRQRRLHRSPEQTVRGGEVIASLPLLPHVRPRPAHTGVAVIRSTIGPVCVISGQGLRGRPRDLTDSGVHRDVRRGVRRGPRGRVRDRGSGQALSVVVGVRRSSGAGLRGHRYDAADLHNVPRGIMNSQRATGCLCTADGQSKAEHARGAGCDQLGRCLHHDFPFISAPRYWFATTTLTATHKLTRRAR